MKNEKQMTTDDLSEWPYDEGDALDLEGFGIEQDDGQVVRFRDYVRVAVELPAPYYAKDDGPGWLVRKAPGQPWRWFRLDSAPPARRAWRTTDGTIVATDLTLRSALRAAHILRGKHAGK